MMVVPLDFLVFGLKYKIWRRLSQQLQQHVWLRRLSGLSSKLSTLASIVVWFVCARFKLPLNDLVGYGVRLGLRSKIGSGLGPEQDLQLALVILGRFKKLRFWGPFTTFLPLVLFFYYFLDFTSLTEHGVIPHALQYSVHDDINFRIISYSAWALIQANLMALHLEAIKYFNYVTLYFTYGK